MKVFRKTVSVFVAAALLSGMVTYLPDNISDGFMIPVSAAGKGTRYEAEDSVISEGEACGNDQCSGGKFVDFTSGGNCVFTVDVPSDGYYDLVFRAYGNEGEKWNNVEVDGVNIGNFLSEKNLWTDTGLECAYLKKGTRKISFVTDWAWTRLDYLEVVPMTFEPEKLYNVSSKPCDPDADVSAKKLMKFIADNYGKNIISGQMIEGNIPNGLESKELVAIKKGTGKLPAMIGVDLMDYMPVRIKLGAQKAYGIDTALRYAEEGGIVTVMWHWSAPEKFIKKGNDESTGNPAWWGGHNTWNLNGFDLSDILDNPKGEDYKLLMKDIEAAAIQLKRLRDAGVPVLFRPLHEASGTWFWWGSDGPDAYKRLYKLVFKKLTKDYGLHNLIWVWNGQAKDWYPGDEYVDIIAEDIYDGERNYDVHSSKFVAASNYTSANKVITLAETGTLFDIDKAISSKTMWSWFLTWCYDFVADNNKELNGIWTEKSMWKKVYGHKNVLTLDDVKEYFKDDGGSSEKSADISAAKVSIPKKTYKYTGKAIKPKPTVTLGGKKLVKGKDYTVSYKNNKKAGKAYVIIKGKGNYTGSVKIKFTIKK